MPKRHGALVRNKKGPQYILGIWQVFHPWVNPGLLNLQGHNIRHPQDRPHIIEYHFRRVVIRLVRSLGCLHQHAREYDRFLEAGGLAGPHPEMAFDIPEEAGIAADSVFHYLTLFIDDLARIIPYVLTEEGGEPNEPDGFTQLKNHWINEQRPASQPVKDLFEMLDQPDSWWSLGFKRRVGMRQRLTHYTDLVYFSSSTKAGDTMMTSDISLISIGGTASVANFENVLQNLLTNLCEWLDKLDQRLLAHLSERLKRKGIPWNPLSEAIPAVWLPEPDDARLDASHYLYLPVCSRP